MTQSELAALDAAATQDLEPCPNPWCGGSLYCTYHRPPLWRVMCGCGVKGPTAYTEAEAITAWSAPLRAEPAAHLAEALQALRDVVNPLGYLRRKAEEEGNSLNGNAYAIANDLGFVQGIARAALAAMGERSALKQGEPW